MIELWQQMADLTMQKCKQKCRILGSCCSPEYCQMASEYAKEKGITLIETGNKLPFLDVENHCVVPPHLRPLCTLHQCDINGWGFSPNDPEWTEKYFQLREKLDDDN
jgi:hypothetical protein